MPEADQDATFGGLLRSVRLEAGLTQEALAERAGVSLRTIQLLEADGARPRRYTAQQLAEALGLSPEQRARIEAAASPAPRRRVREPDVSSTSSQPEPGASTPVREAERKLVTVLYAELGGAAELIDSLGFEQAESALDGALRAMTAAARRFEGTVTRAQGDGLSALFGAPLTMEEHATQACRAALAMRAALGVGADDASPSLQVRIGLDSGEVVVRASGESDYLARGEVVQFAGGLAQLARSGQIVLTVRTLGLVDESVAVESLGPLAVGDRNRPVVVFELREVGPPRTHLQALTARELTPLVGRQAEQVALRQAREQVAAGRGQVVALVGEPGVGKSRLLWETIQAASAAGFRVLQTSTVGHIGPQPYLPFVNLLKEYAEIETHEEAAAIREKLAGRLLGLGEALESSLPPLLFLLDVPSDDAHWQVLEPLQRRRRIQEAIKRLLLRACLEQPLMLVLDNLHWLDLESQALLDSLVDSVPAARLLLLVSYRPEYEHRWGNKTYYTQLRIDPLAGDEARALLESLLGPEPDGAAPEAAAPRAALTRRLIERTEGNPFFLEESVRALFETGVLVGERGAYRVASGSDGTSIQVPPTVQAVLAARIDRLLPEEKRLLQTAAVIGKDVPYALLQAVAGEGNEAGSGTDDALQASLAQLQSAEFLYEARLFPDLEYTFKHVLTLEVAYGSLLQERRRALHARVIEAIEGREVNGTGASVGVETDHLPAQVERLAYHGVRAERWQKAAAYSRQAGLKAVGRSANREAAAYFEQALSALSHLPRSRETLEQAIDIRFDLYNSLVAIGEPAQLVDGLREAEVLAEELGDRRRLCRASTFLGSALRLQGEHDRAVEAGRRGVAVADALGDFTLRLVAGIYLPRAYRERGDYREAVEGFRWTVSVLEGERAHERMGGATYPVVFARAWLALCLTDLGEFTEGAAYGEEGIELAEPLEHPYSLALARLTLGGLYLEQGRLERAIPLLEQCLAMSRASDLAFPALWASWRLGTAYTLAGRLAEGLPLLEQAVEHPPPGGGAVEGSLRLTRLGEAYLLAGRAREAAPLAAKALDLAVGRNERGNLAQARHLLGGIAARGDPPDAERAEAEYRQAFALAEVLGMRPLQAHCQRGLGCLYGRMGRLEEARSELAAAIALYRALGMTFWLPQAEQELARVG